MTTIHRKVGHEVAFVKGAPRELLDISSKLVLGDNIVDLTAEKKSEISARIDEFAADNVVLGCDTDTARRYGEIKAGLRLKGNPLPENDIWIAAIALQHGLTMITRDTHFNEIETLKIVVW